MREVLVKVYQFNELSPEIQEEIIDREVVQWDISDEVEPFLDDLLRKMGLPNITVSTFAIQQKEDDHVFLQGELTDHLDVLNKDGNLKFKTISSAFLDPEDVTDDNQSGLSIFFKEDIDEESEDAQEVTEVITKELTKIEETLVMAAQQFCNQRHHELRGEVTKVLQDFEYFQDGSTFQEIE